MKARAWLMAACVLLAAVGARVVFRDGQHEHVPATIETDPAAREGADGVSALVERPDRPERRAVPPEPAVSEPEAPRESTSERVRELAALRAENVELREELAALRVRNAWLEVELQLCGSEVTQGPVGRWLAGLRPEERPGVETLRQVGYLLRDYPVELTAAEGLWVAERFREDDWQSWGPTVDEALILFLGPARLAAELPAERVAELREEYAEEGYFGG